MKFSEVVRDVLLPVGLAPKDLLQNLDPANRYVNEETIGSDFIYGDTTLLFSGPPLLAQAIKHPEIITPIGVTTTLSISQNKTYIPWEEFGFKYERAIPGKIKNAIGMDSIKNNKGNLLYQLYGWMVKISKITGNTGMKFKSQPGVNIEDPTSATGSAGSGDITGYQQFLDLGSEIFNIPFGLLIIQLDGANEIRVSGYAQICKLPINSQQFSNQPMSTENVQIIVTRISPAIGLKVSGKAKQPYTMAPPGKYTPPKPSPAFA